MSTAVACVGAQEPSCLDKKRHMDVEGDNEKRGSYGDRDSRLRIQLNAHGKKEKRAGSSVKVKAQLVDCK